MKKKPKQTKPRSRKRSGGPNPLATPRKLLEGKSLNYILETAIRGETSRKDERIAYFIASLRQFDLRLATNISPESRTLYRKIAGYPSDDESDYNEHRYPNDVKNGDLMEVSEVIVSKCVRQLARWLATATPKKLRSLASFLEARPIKPMHRLGGQLSPFPVDPKLYVAALVAMDGMGADAKESPLQAEAIAEFRPDPAKQTAESKKANEERKRAVHEDTRIRNVNLTIEEIENHMVSCGFEYERSEIQPLINLVSGGTRKVGRPRKESRS